MSDNGPVVRVMIVDDDAEVRTGVRDILATSASCRIVAEAGDGRECLRALDTTAVDVVVLDVRMPTLDGIATLEAIRRRRHATRVLLLTTFSDSDYVSSAVKWSADGFLLKSGDPRDLIRAVTAWTDGPWFSPTIARILADDVRRTAHLRDDAATARTRLETMAPREREVAALIARGHTNGEIASRLFLGESTVKSYVGSAMRRVGARNRVELAAMVWASEYESPP
ncbi:MAG: response regulator transcription factor [Corynebacteriales bacterium]|nr:response regulator transcription factor [Mycobacteriales bacterium]